VNPKRCPKAGEQSDSAAPSDGAQPRQTGRSVHVGANKMLSITTPLANIKGLPSRFLLKFQKLTIKTVRDLLWHFPTRYEDFSTTVKIADLETNQTATIQGFIRKVALRRTFRKRMVVVEATIADETGAITAIWFNQPFIAKNLRIGHLANFAGKVSSGDDGLFLSNPSYELVTGAVGETRHTAGLIPTYPETKGLTSKGIRYLMRVILGNVAPIEDFIPPEILEKNRLPEVNTALHAIHSPKTLEEAAAGKKRFAFEDLFLLQINNIKARLELAKEKAPSLPVGEEDLHAIIAKLPFQLTPSQHQSLHEIIEDIGKTRPMNRLLQGDVGSGKTVIAAIAAIIAAKNGYQAAFMAPTEVLARQHYKTLTTIFGHLRIPIGILTSSESKIFFEEGLAADVKKGDVQKRIESGEIKIVIGTHAIISPYGRSPEGRQKGVRFKNLGLAIVDEQHRFGVSQRAALLAQKQKVLVPHFLSMSATPIPRTLTLTIFGDLDLSLITELPVGRKPIITKVVAPENRAKAYAFVRGEIKKGRQAFVICPRIEKAEHVEGEALTTLGVAWSEVKAVKEEYEKLSQKIFPDLKVGMLHGKLKAAEKAKIMADFSEKNLDILVSTSVVEVGVDIPNATIMLIEGAERFGLSQLYQFRGRVGRGEHQSFCLLFTDSSSESAARRLQSLLEAKNGFELAEKDLAIRGPGEFLGESQTGLPDLAMQALNNMELVKLARAAAAMVIKKDQTLKSHPALKEKFASFRKQIHLE